MPTCGHYSLDTLLFDTQMLTNASWGLEKQFTMEILWLSRKQVDVGVGTDDTASKVVTSLQLM